MCLQNSWTLSTIRKKKLFGLWGKNYEPSANPIACDYAATVGLACLERQGSRRILEFINRPAILQLRDERGRTRQVVVEQLDGELAMIATPVGSQQVPFREIEEYWYGDFRVLWRIPEFMTGDGFYGDDSGQQLWIGARMMELAETAPQARPEWRLMLTGKLLDLQCYMQVVLDHT